MRLARLDIQDHLDGIILPAIDRDADQMTTRREVLHEGMAFGDRSSHLAINRHHQAHVNAQDRRESHDEPPIIGIARVVAAARVRSLVRPDEEQGADGEE